MRTPLAVIMGALLIAVVPTPASGASGGPDGDAHPMVGDLYVDWDGSGTITWDEQVCTGSFAGSRRMAASTCS